MDHDLVKLFIDGATCIAASVLAFVTWQLVHVTRHHAHYAEKMASAADRLGEILDHQGKELLRAAELNALIITLAADHVAPTGPQSESLRTIINRLYSRVMETTSRQAES